MDEAYVEGHCLVILKKRKRILKKIKKCHIKTNVLSKLGNNWKKEVVTLPSTQYIIQNMS